MRIPGFCSSCHFECHHLLHCALRLPTFYYVYAGKVTADEALFTLCVSFSPSPYIWLNCFHLPSSVRCCCMILYLRFSVYLTSHRSTPLALRQVPQPPSRQHSAMPSRSSHVIERHIRNRAKNFTADIERILQHNHLHPNDRLRRLQMLADALHRDSHHDFTRYADALHYEAARRRNKAMRAARRAARQRAQTLSTPRIVQHQLFTPRIDDTASIWTRLKRCASAVLGCLVSTQRQSIESVQATNTAPQGRAGQERAGHQSNAQDDPNGISTDASAAIAITQATSKPAPTAPRALRPRLVSRFDRLRVVAVANLVPQRADRSIYASQTYSVPAPKNQVEDPTRRVHVKQEPDLDTAAGFESDMPFIKLEPMTP